MSDAFGLNIAPTFRGNPIENGDILTQMGPVAGPTPVILRLGESLYSPGRTLRLTMQASDGNAVLQYAETATLPPSWPTTALSPNEVTWIPFWATDSQGRNAEYLAMQDDGNFVIYQLDGTRIGPFGGGGLPDGDNTGTGGNPGAFFRLQDDGNLVLTAQSGAVLWTSGTSVAESKGSNAS